jgi:hypothetical protein
MSDQLYKKLIYLIMSTDVAYFRPETVVTRLDKSKVLMGIVLEQSLLRIIMKSKEGRWQATMEQFSLLFVQHLKVLEHLPTMKMTMIFF